MEPKSRWLFPMVIVVTTILAVYLGSYFALTKKTDGKYFFLRTNRYAWTPKWVLANYQPLIYLEELVTREPVQWGYTEYIQ